MLLGQICIDTHLGDTFIPALDDFALTNHKFEWFVASSGRVENAAIAKGASVVNDDSLSALWECASCMMSNCDEIEEKNQFKSLRAEIDGI